MNDYNRSDILAAAIAARIDKLEVDLNVLAADLKSFGLQMSSEIVGKVPALRELVTDLINRGNVEVRGDDSAAWAHHIRDMYGTNPSLRINAESQEGLGYDMHGELVVKPVREFIQVDGWANIESGDYIMVPDYDGDVLACGRTREPQRSDTTVRILIASDAKHDDVLRIIRKQLEWCELNDGILRFADDNERAFGGVE